MAKVTRRTVEAGKEAWVCDWYDFGKRKVKRFGTRREAEDFLARIRIEQRQRPKPTVDPHITLKDYAGLFMSTKAEALDLRPRTRERMRSSLGGHILPALGAKKVRELDRPTVRRFLEGRLSEESSLQGQRGDEKAGRRRLARGSVLLLLHTISAILREAVEDQLLVTNPLRGLGKALNLGKRKAEKVKALDADQLARFFAAALTEAPEALPAFAVMGIAGLRLGEALALRWEHVDLAGGTLHVSEQVGGAPLKDGEARDVEMAAALKDVLADLRREHREAALQKGHEESYVTFPEFMDGTDDRARQRAVKFISRRMARVLKVAGLPGHHTPHSLRHSFAAILISRGVSPAYVQQQLGHASIALTVDTYGSWLPIRVPGAVDALGKALAGIAAGPTGKEKPETGKGVSLTAALNLAEAASF